MEVTSAAKMLVTT